MLKVEHTLGGAKEGGLHGKGDALQRVLGSARTSQPQREEYRSLRERFLHQLGDIPVQYHSTAPQGGSLKDGGTKQIVLSLSKTVHRQTGLGSSGTGTCESRRDDVRPPTRIIGREELQFLALIASSTCEGALRASGMDSVMTRPFYTTEEEKTLFRSAPLPLDFSLEGTLRKTAWLAGSCVWCGDDALGPSVVRVNRSRLRGSCETRAARKLQQVPGRVVGHVWLPLSWGSDAVTDFLAGWKMIPVKTFRQGYRRTWIVRATDQPMSTKLQHEFGLAVIKRTVMQKARQDQVIQKWMPASEQKKTGRDAVHRLRQHLPAAPALHKTQTERIQDNSWEHSSHAKQ